MVNVAKKEKAPTWKELKQPDAFVETSSQAAEIAAKYRLPIFATFGGALLIFTLVWMFSFLSDQQNQQATELLGKALKIHDAPLAKKDDKKDDKKDTDTDTVTYASAEERSAAAFPALEAVIASHPKSRAAAFARIYLGNLLLQFGYPASPEPKDKAEKEKRAPSLASRPKPSEKAISLFQDALASFSPSEPLAILALDSLAYAYEQNKAQGEALKKLEDFGEKGSPTFRSYALFRLAEFFQHQGEMKKAQTYYQRVAKDKSELQDAAKKRLATLAF